MTVSDSAMQAMAFIVDEACVDPAADQCRGLQVRFGVLNAGNFGVSQSRKRTFIWAAAPGDLLPDWPKLLHIFRSPQLAINLPGNVKVTARHTSYRQVPLLMVFCSCIEVSLEGQQEGQKAS